MEQEFKDQLITIGIVIAVVHGAIFGCFCSWLAQEKGYDRISWLWLGVGFGIIALLTLVGAPDLEDE